MTLIVGIISIGLAVGRRDAILERNVDAIKELRSITTDLVKMSIETTTSDKHRDDKLKDLGDRILRLEQSINNRS